MKDAIPGPQDSEARPSAMLTESLGAAPSPTPPAEGATVEEGGASPAPPATAPAVAQVPGYEVLGLLGEGGMGAVLRARDPELGRELAVKVLLEEHHDDPRMVQRFLEEAQIGGQLQHPGVVPVYEAGRLPDRRPYFTMKLVEGRTLAALLQERPSSAHDLPRFLKIFEQVCQTLAYAHSKGVIHRDLKPLNVMVGAFGEVQVMDWGLAKVLGGGVRTARSEQTEGRSASGSVLGTPAYMAPEQACGDVEGLDARCDAFGLGAILCEVLTGAPPYRGRDKGELLRQAARGDTEDAFTRLDGSGVETELVGLAKRCLTAEPSGRPTDAGAVAAAVTAYLAGVQERLRKAELAQTAAQARAAVERRARRLTAALAAAVLLLVLLGGGGWLWLQAERANRTAQTNRAVNEALNQATTFRGRAGTAQGRAALELAAQARAQAQRAESLVESGGADAALAAQVRGLLADLDADEQDRQLLAALEAARLTPVEVNVEEHKYTRERAAFLYREAFRVYGMPAGEGDAVAVAARLEKRPEAVREAVLAALDAWAPLAKREAGMKGEAPHLDWLREVRAAVTPDGWRKQVQEAAEQNGADRGAALEKLAESADVDHLPAHALTMLARNLRAAGDEAAALSLLRRTQVGHADDFWVNADLGQALRRIPDQQAEAVRYLTAAVALYPDSYVARLNLGETLLEQGKLDEAVAECRKVIELEPGYARAYCDLGIAMARQGKAAEAVAAFRQTLAINPNFIRAYDYLIFLKAQNKDDVIAAFRKTVELHPKDASAYHMLGAVLEKQGKLDEALAEFRRVLAINPGIEGPARDAMVLAFARQGRLEEVRAAWQRLLEGNPPNHDAWYGYAELCLFLGREDDYRRARTALLARFGDATDPQVAERTGRACLLLPASGDEVRQASALVDRALAAGPKHYLYYYFELAKGLVEYRRDRPEQAIPLLRESASQIPQLTPRLVLAMALYRTGQKEEARQTLAAAVAAYHWDEAGAAGVDDWIYHILRREAEELIVPNLSAFLSGQYQPQDNKERLELVGLCRFRRRYLAAARLYTAAFADDAKLADSRNGLRRYNAACSAALAACGQGEDAAATGAPERDRWRKQAREWLRADLALWTKKIDDGKPVDRTAAARTLRRWKENPDLAGVRDADALAPLPPEERDAWHQLWADVDAALTRAAGKAP